MNDFRMQSAPGGTGTAASAPTGVRHAFLITGDATTTRPAPLDAHADAFGAQGISAVAVLGAEGYALIHVESAPGADVETVRETVCEAVYPGLGLAAQAETFDEIFEWSEAGRDAPADASVAIFLALLPGSADAYRTWIASDVVDTLKAIWARTDIGRHDVLISGDTVIGFYECAGPETVAAAFADPASASVMESGLGALLDTTTTGTLPTLKEEVTWHA
jgi:hypothetical protein